MGNVKCTPLPRLEDPGWWLSLAGLTADCALIGELRPTRELVLSHPAPLALINARGNN